MSKPNEVPRKALIASDKPDNFAFLGKRFTFTDDAAEADLIIVDLANPVPTRKWVGAGATAHFIAGPCWTPFVLTAFDGPEDQRALAAIQDILPKEMVIGPVYRKSEDLEATLAWLQSIFPFSNVHNLPNYPVLERLKTGMILQYLREEA
ncbi:MAG TPA: hypothetical protein VF173_18635 [Thermoanaerobaculia bacterium]|nr:hypothetical protein [Thermoanaerobaculia bacterium]